MHWPSSAAGAEGADEEDGSGSFSDDGLILGATLNGDALARSLLDAQTANELGLVRSEVKRLRSKVAALEREKDDMAEDFRNTTKVLLNRIKELEAELSGAQSRPQTAAVIERIEGPGAVAGRGQARPPLPQKGSQVLRIEEEDTPGKSSPSAASPSRGSAAPVVTVEGETSICGNCRRNIPAGNVLAHSVSCYRNNFHCDACAEVIPLREKESHQREWTLPERLLEAAVRRDMDTVQRMLGHGADVCTAVHPSTRETVMHVAARAGDEEWIAFFTAHGVDIDPVNEQGETPLHLAASGVPAAAAGAGVAPPVRLLVELGASLNAVDGKGESPLMMLCRRGAAQTAKYLVEMRADPEVCTKLGDTPIQIAQRNGHHETVLALCSAGAALRSGTPSRSSERRERSGSPMPLVRGPPAGGAVREAAGYPPRPKGVASAAGTAGGGGNLRRSLSGSRRTPSTSGRGGAAGAGAGDSSPPAAPAPRRLPA